MLRRLGALKFYVRAQMSNYLSTVLKLKSTSLYNTLSKLLRPNYVTHQHARLTLHIPPIPSILLLLKLSVTLLFVRFFSFTIIQVSSAIWWKFLELLRSFNSCFPVQAAALRTLYKQLHSLSAHGLERVLLNIARYLSLC